MKYMTRKVIADRESQSDKTKHFLIDVILGDKDLFPTEDTVSDNRRFYLVEKML